MLASKRNGTLYIGVTSDLIKRNWQHKEKQTGGFTAKYTVNNLVYYEIYDSAEEAIRREKIIKKFLRKDKLELIENFNPEWKDLYETLL